MKPINSSEKSKLFWQFFFIFFALCIVPCAIIFYSYYVTPAKLDELDQQRLSNYSDFEHNQKFLVKKMIEIDSCIRLLNNGSNMDPTFLYTQIPNDIINNVKSKDTGLLVRTIAASYTNWFTNAKTLRELSTANRKLNEDLQKSQGDLNKMQEDKKQQDLLNKMSQPH